jgi:hypothetical protein
MNITIHIHRTADCLPDADTDVLVWEEGESEAWSRCWRCARLSMRR